MRIASQSCGTVEAQDRKDHAPRRPANHLGFEQRVLPRLRLAGGAQADQTIALCGSWTALGLRHEARALRKELARYAGKQALRWDLSRVQTLDHVGALLLWQGWGRRMPADIIVRDDMRRVFARLQGDAPRISRHRFSFSDPIVSVGSVTLEMGAQLGRFIGLMGQVLLELAGLLRVPASWPWAEVSAGVYRMGAQALGITALVGFLIGIILSYLSAQELRDVGLNAYVVDFLGIAIVRELGPLVAAILIAGRSGSSITAQLGVMRLNDELDALTAMGIAYTRRLVLPKVLALALVQPLLTLWTDLFGLLGGMLVANYTLGVSYAYFVKALPGVVPSGMYWLGLAKGVSFGAAIALVACHFGLRIKSDTESLGAGTTSAVVAAITSVIVLDAAFAVLFPDSHF